MKRNVTPRADLFRMCQPVLFQRPFLFPFQKVEGVVAGFLYHFFQFGVGNVCDGAERVDARAEKDFVFDDVAAAGEDVLVE